MSFPEVKIEAKGHTGLISRFSHLSSFLVFKHTKLLITSGTSQLMLPVSGMFSLFLVWLATHTVGLSINFTFPERLFLTTLHKAVPTPLLIIYFLIALFSSLKCLPQLKLINWSLIVISFIYWFLCFSLNRSCMQEGTPFIWSLLCLQALVLEYLAYNRQSQ